MKCSNHVKEFYAVRVNSGQEKSFLKCYEKMIERSQLKSLFGKAYVYWANKTQVCPQGKVKVRVENRWPDYVIIEMHLNNKSMQQLRRIKSVREIVANYPGSMPIPISAQEIEQLLEQIQLEATMGARSEDK